MAEPGVFDLAIVGGGPAGMAATMTAVRHGLSVAVIDEQPRPGGHILRQPPTTFTVSAWLAGRPYRKLRALLSAFEATSGITWLGGRAAIGIARPQADAPFRLHLAGPASVETIEAQRVLIAAGCHDLPVPLAGWTLPGVMAAGGMQAFVKSQQIVPGERFVLAGTHPLMLVVAAQIVAGDGAVAMVAFDQPLSRALGKVLAHAGAALRHIPTLGAAASALWTLRRRGVPVRFGLPLRGIEGDGRVAAATFADRSVACTNVALCYGFVPQSDLSRLAGATVLPAEPDGGWRTAHDDWMRTDVAGLSVAGETAGIGGAAMAMVEGRLAAIGLLLDSSRITASEAERVARPLRAQLASLRGFAALLAAVADPRDPLARAVPPETILCRCEDVSYATVQAAIAHAEAPNAIKLATRVGMGLCQGRSCEAALLRELARNSGPQRGGFIARFPIRPTRIGDLLAPNPVGPDAAISPVIEH